jgi:hypothetical protein
MRVEVRLKNGRIFKTNEAVAKVLRNRMLVAEDSYPTRVLITETSPITRPDYLDELSPEQLHALAKERGVEVHHRAGPEKVKAALREAQA